MVENGEPRVRSITAIIVTTFFVSFQNFKLPMSNALLRQRTPSGKHTHFNWSFDHFPLLNSHLILSANVAYLFLLSSKSRKPLEIEKMFCFGFGRLTQGSLNKMPCCVMNAHYKVINLLTSKYLLALPFSPHLENHHKNEIYFQFKLRGYLCNFRHRSTLTRRTPDTRNNRLAASMFICLLLLLVWWLI